MLTQVAWCADEKNCPVGKHKEILSINAEIIKGKDITNIAHSYNLQEDDVFTHIIESHHRDMERLEKGRAADALQDDLFDMIDENTDNVGILKMMIKYMVKVFNREKANPHDVIVFIREVRKTMLTISELEKEQGIVARGNMTVNIGNDAIEKAMQTALQRIEAHLCGECKITLYESIPSEGKGLIPMKNVEEVMKLKPGVTKGYVKSIMDEYDKTDDGEENFQNIEEKARKRRYKKKKEIIEVEPAEA
jgi:hypothetical protein